jgi:NADPH:quinone reductase-like Zn-dependent oxidoreductase
MSNSYPELHDAVVTLGKRLPLAIREYKTAAPGPGEVVVRVQWTASSPLNLHQADGGLLVTPPFILGDTFAGVVVAEGPEDLSAERPLSAPVKVGHQVMGFSPPETKSAGFQTYVVCSRRRVGRVPSNMPISEAVTAPSSLITAIHAVTKDLQLELPWPRDVAVTSKQSRDPILVWGAAGSVGQFAVQVLAYWGYKNVVAVASSQHHDLLRSFGAAKCFDYKKATVVDEIKAYAPRIRHILDCIGHAHTTLQPLSNIAGEGTKVAMMLPIIVTDATEELEPEYSMDPAAVSSVKWASGVELLGVRTFFYEQV